MKYLSSQCWSLWRQGYQLPLQQIEESSVYSNYPDMFDDGQLGSEGVHAPEEFVQGYVLNDGEHSAFSIGRNYRVLLSWGDQNLASGRFWAYRARGT